MPNIPGRVKIDAQAVDPDHATELVAHHLMLAAAYFDATPDDMNATKHELFRLLEDGSPPETNQALLGAMGWLEAVIRFNRKLDKKAEEMVQHCGPKTKKEVQNVLLKWETCPRSTRDTGVSLGLIKRLSREKLLQPFYVQDLGQEIQWDTVLVITPEGKLAMANKD